MGKSTKLVSPTGKEITGTLERLTGVADILNLRRAETGTVEFDWGSYTEIDWNGQQTVTRLPKAARQDASAPKQAEIVFVDEDGDEWLASELIDVDESKLEG